jgi:hypothetical protein
MPRAGAVSTRMNVDSATMAPMPIPSDTTHTKAKPRSLKSDRAA